MNTSTNLIHGRKAFKLVIFAARVSVLAVAFTGLNVMSGSSMEASAQDPQWLPISQAILNRDVELVQSLVESGEDINQRLFNGETPAIMAATTACWDIVLYLLEAGADPTLTSGRGITVATRAKTSRVASHTKEFQDLAEVKKILASKGLL